MIQFSALNLVIIFIKTSTCVSQFSKFLNEIMNEWINEMNEMPIFDSSLLLDCVI